MEVVDLPSEVYEIPFGVYEIPFKKLDLLAPMKAITYILADDEAIYREMALQYLSLAPALTCLKVCEHALEVREVLHELEPDLLILDIDMPGLTGLQLMKSLTRKPYVIFISSYTQFALEAFDVDAIDFIKKPLAPERLLRAIDKVRHLIELRETLSGPMESKAAEADSFFIRENHAYIRIVYSDVLYIESLADFVKIHLANGTEKLALVNLKNLEQQLPGHLFLRISRSYMVNKQKVTTVQPDTVSIGKIQLPVGAAHADKVMEHIVGPTAIKRHV